MDGAQTNSNLRGQLDAFRQGLEMSGGIGNEWLGGEPPLFIDEGAFLELLLAADWLEQSFEQSA